MKVENAVQPRPEQLQEFLTQSGEGPVAMVNLLKFRERAAYPDGRETKLSGQEAYLLYATEMRKLVESAGGRFVFSGQVKNLLLGEVESLWDTVAVVEYPSAKALVQIASSPEFQAIETHRVAGLEGQLNVTTTSGAF